MSSPLDKFQTSKKTDDTPVKRDPEDRKVHPEDKDAIKEKNLDKTLADSFPTSDPPSTIPDPEEEDAA